MNNKFKIEQISTDQFVLRRQEGFYSEYINHDLIVVKLDVIGNNPVVYNSLYVAEKVLQTFNSKQLLNEVRDKVVISKGLSIKSIKFKYKVNEDGSEAIIGVNNAS